MTRYSTLIRKTTTLTLALVLFGVISPSYGASTDLSVGVRQSSSPSNNSAEITKFVQDRVNTLSKGAPKDIHDAREELSRQTESNSNVTPSAEFMDVYCATIAAELPAAQKTTNTIVTRLNATIVLKRISSSSQSPRLAPLISTALSDESPAVALWGMRAASSLVSSIVNHPVLGKNETLTKDIISSVQKNPQMGALVLEAYKAISFGQNDTPAIAISASATDKLIDSTNLIIEARVKHYVEAQPSDPQIDRDPPNLLTKLTVMKAMKKPQQVATIQHLSDLINVAAARASATNTSQSDRKQLVEVIKSSSAAILLLTGEMGFTDAAPVLERLSKITNPPSSTDLTAIMDALRKSHDLADLKDPPEVKAVEVAGESKL